MLLDLDIEALVADSMPADDELTDLIEAAYLQAQIDAETQSLAFAWLERNDIREHSWGS